MASCTQTAHAVGYIRYASLIWLLVLGLLYPWSAQAVCTPSGSLTTNLQLCQPASGETGWASAINGNATILDGLFNSVPSILPAKGGTGINTSSSTGIPIVQSGIWSIQAVTNGQILMGGATAPTVNTISGTSNQIIVTNGPGTITLSTPQNIDTAASVQHGSLSLGASITLQAGALGMKKSTASLSAPGAGNAKFEIVCGTNAGTAQLIMYAGTSGATFTVVNNVGSGVSGC